jgi:hypothetical protein
MGRNRDVPNYTDEERAEIIAHVLVNVACGRPVDRIFREDDLIANGVKLPAQSTFWLWLFQDESNELSGKLARAREYGVEALIDRAIATAETTQMGEEITIERDPEHQKDLDDGAEITDGDGNKYEGMTVKVKRSDMLAHRKLYIETMFKAAQMLKPKTYGPKLDLTSDGQKLGLGEELEAMRLREAEYMRNRK